MNGMLETVEKQVVQDGWCQNLLNLTSVTPTSEGSWQNCSVLREWNKVIYVYFLRFSFFQWHLACCSQVRVSIRVVMLAALGDDSNEQDACSQYFKKSFCWQIQNTVFVVIENKPWNINLIECYFLTMAEQQRAIWYVCCDDPIASSCSKCRWRNIHSFIMVHYYHSLQPKAELLPIYCKKQQQDF